MSLKDLKVEFAPEFLETCDLSEEELAEIKALVEAKIANGSLFEDSEAVDLEALAEEDPELYEELCKNIESMPTESCGSVGEIAIDFSKKDKPTLH